MTKYTRRIDEFEAEQWSGSNWHQMLAFAGRDHVTTDGKTLFLKTGVNSSITVPKDWWIMRNQNGVLSACDPVAFNAMYEQVEDPE